MSRRCAQVVAAVGIAAAVVIGGGGAAASAEVPQTTSGLPTGWGANSLGAFGPPTSDGPAPVSITAESGSTQVSMGCSHALYLHPDGTVWASGWNSWGQLGDGDSTSTTTATQVLGLTDVVAVAAGCYHSVALRSDGTVWMWGQYQGVTTSNPPDGTCPGFGSGEPVPCFLHPTQWIGLSGITQIAAGVLDELALASDGTVYTGGQIGNGHLALPAPVIDVAMQSYAAEAITTSGQVYSWRSSEAPALVAGITGFASALGGGSLSGYAVTLDGTVWAWGDDRYGQLGDGKETSESTAIKVPGLPAIVAVAAGFYHAVALDVSGGVWAWGDNVDGEVGPQQPQAVKATPSQVPGIGKALALTAGGYSTIALVSRAPTVTGVSPNAGLESGGTSVTITGTELTAATAVKFGSTNATSFTVDSPTEITVTAPSGAGIVDATVTTAGGMSATSSADRFTYVPVGPAPTVARVAPNKGSTGGGTSVTVTGTGFAGVTAVRFGSASAASYVVNSPRSITATSPPETAAIVDVTVTTPNSTSPFSTKDRFKFAPTVTNLSPNIGSKAGGTSVTVSGTGFALGSTATIFKFGSTRAKSVNCASATTCTILAPAHAVGTVDVIATVNKVSSPKNPPTDRFTYN
jgi:hypothetical protein